MAQDVLHLCGQVLKGRYQIQKQLGAGGMGVVYQGMHMRLGQPCAIKLIHPCFGHDGAIARRFRREACVGSQVRHPGLVQVFDYDQLDDGTLFYGMELLSGRSIATVLEGGPLPWDQAVEVCMQAADALGALHAAGVVHRDVKPANLQLLDDGRVKVLDLGVARASLNVADDDLTDVRTATGSRIGTAQYMAPEQICDCTRVDPRADVYALAVVLYELVVGQRLFHGESEQDLLVQKCQQSLQRVPVTLSGPRGPVPSELDALVSRCLAELAERPRSMTEMARQLEWLLPQDRSALQQALSRRAQETVSTLVPLWDPPAEVEVSLSSLLQLSQHPLAERYMRRVRRLDAPPSRQRWRWRRAAVGVGGGLLVAGLAGVIGAWIGGRSGAGTPTSAGADARATVSGAAPVSVAAPSVAQPVVGAQGGPAPAPRVRPGTVRVLVDDFAEVYIDGVRHAEGPPYQYRLPPGQHQVRIVRPLLGREVSRMVQLSAGGTVVVNEPEGAAP